MSEQGGALAGLRAAFSARMVAEVELWAASRYTSPHPRERAKATANALDAELARVEARIDRLVRVVRAWDELASVETRTFDMPGDSYNAARFVATTDLWTAREAITEDDLT